MLIKDVKLYYVNAAPLLRQVFMLVELGIELKCATQHYPSKTCVSTSARPIRRVIESELFLSWLNYIAIVWVALELNSKWNKAS